MLAHKKSRSQKIEKASDFGETVPSGALLLVTELDCTALAALAPHPLNSSGITDWATAQETVSETPSGSTQTKPHLYFCAK